MKSVRYVETDETGLDSIAGLWEHLNSMHAGQSSAFAELYRRRTFADRKRELMEKIPHASMLVHIAQDAETGAMVGFCVSSAYRGGEGEVDSLYVDPGYRGAGVGDAFMRRAKEWMDSFGVHTKKIAVYAGNDGVMRFYGRYGFAPRYIIMEQAPEGTGAGAVTKEGAAMDDAAEKHLSLLSVFHYVVGGLGLVFSLLPLIHIALGISMLRYPASFAGNGGTPPPSFIAWAMVAMGSAFMLLGLASSVCVLLSGRYLARRRKYWFSFIVGCVECLFFPFGTVLGVFTVIVLSDRRVKEMYAAGGAPGCGR